MDLESVTLKVEQLFGDTVASPEHCPIVFRYQVKLATWMLQQEQLAESKDPQ